MGKDTVLYWIKTEMQENELGVDLCMPTLLRLIYGFYH